MIRLAAYVAVAAGLALVSVGAAQEPRFRGGTHTVSLWATVLDRDGRLVPDLRREDFEIYDNGVRQNVTVFANDLQPITIVIMLDRSGSMRMHFQLVRDAAEVFVRQLLPGDRARIGSFSNRVQIDPKDFTSDQAELTRILHEELQDAGPTPLWNATSSAMNALGSQPGRRVVLLFTDGEDTPGVGRNVSVGELRGRVETEDVMIYGIGLAERCAPRPSGATDRPERSFQRGPGPGTPGGGFPPSGPMPGGRRPPMGGPRPGVPRPGPGLPVPGLPFPPRVPSEPLGASVAARCKDVLPDPDLRELTAVGGGGYFELDTTADLKQTFARIADELHQQYLLAFTPSVLDDSLHHLEVRVTQPGLTSRSRKTYFAARER